VSRVDTGQPRPDEALPGRTLSSEDLEHYQKIVVALHETIRVIAEIDIVIEQYGGWPGAFKTADKGADN